EFRHQACPTPFGDGRSPGMNIKIRLTSAANPQTPAESSRDLVTTFSGAAFQTPMIEAMPKLISTKEKKINSFQQRVSVRSPTRKITHTRCVAISTVSCDHTNVPAESRPTAIQVKYAHERNATIVQVLDPHIRCGDFSRFFCAVTCPSTQVPVSRGKRERLQPRPRCASTLPNKDSQPL